MTGWKSKKNDNGKVSHFKDEKKIRDSEPDINVEININTDELEDFAEERIDEFNDEPEPNYSIGDFVRVSGDNDNENYDDFKNKILKITNVATNRNEHPGFDEGVNEALYDFETIDGKEVHFSLYDYELESVDDDEVKKYQTSYPDELDYDDFDDEFYGDVLLYVDEDDHGMDDDDPKQKIIDDPVKRRQFAIDYAKKHNAQIYTYVDLDSGEVGYSKGVRFVNRINHGEYVIVKRDGLKVDNS